MSLFAPPIPVPSYSSGQGPTPSTSMFAPPSLYRQYPGQQTSPQTPDFAPPSMYMQSQGTPNPQSMLPSSNFLQPSNTPSSTTGLPQDEWSRRAMQNPNVDIPGVNPQLMSLIRALMSNNMLTNSQGGSSMQGTGPIQTGNI